MLTHFQKNPRTLLVITQIFHYKNNIIKHYASSSTITYTLKSRQYIYFPYKQFRITR